MIVPGEKFTNHTVKIDTRYSSYLRLSSLEPQLGPGHLQWTVISFWIPRHQLLGQVGWGIESWRWFNHNPEPPGLFQHISWESWRLSSSIASGPQQQKHSHKKKSTGHKLWWDEGSGGHCHFLACLHHHQSNKSFEYR